MVLNPATWNTLIWHRNACNASYLQARSFASDNCEPVISNNKSIKANYRRAEKPLSLYRKWASNPYEGESSTRRRLKKISIIELSSMPASIVLESDAMSKLWKDKRKKKVRWYQSISQELNDIMYDFNHILKFIAVDIELSMALMGSTSFSLASGKQFTTLCINIWVIFFTSLSVTHCAFLISSLSCLMRF